MRSSTASRSQRVAPGPLAVGRDGDRYIPRPGRTMVDCTTGAVLCMIRFDKNVEEHVVLAAACELYWQHRRHWLQWFCDDAMDIVLVCLALVDLDLDIVHDETRIGLDWILELDTKHKPRALELG